MSELKGTRVNRINKLICPLFDIAGNIKKLKVPENIKFSFFINDFDAASTFLKEYAWQSDNIQ